MSPTLTHGNNKNDRARKKREKEGWWTLGDTAELGLQLRPSYFSLKVHGYQCSSTSTDSPRTYIVHFSMALRNVEFPHEWSSTHKCYRKLGTRARVPHPPDTRAREQQKRNQKKSSQSVVYMIIQYSQDMEMHNEIQSINRKIHFNRIKHRKSF